MARISDFIEEHLKQLLREAREGVVEIQRSELAEKFGCVPSQINYVLETRFTPERGYLVESRRGGGGFIRIIRLNLESVHELYRLVRPSIGEALSQAEALGHVARLWEHQIITERERALMEAALRRDVINLELPVRDVIRANLLKAMLLAILRS